MSVTTSEQFDSITFESLIGGGAVESTGEPFHLPGEKTISGLGNVTDEMITAAIPPAAVFLQKRDSTKQAATEKLRQAYPTVRQWAQDAASTNANWPTMSAAQKDTAMRETIRRLGLLLDHVGDLVVAVSKDGDQG